MELRGPVQERKIYFPHNFPQFAGRQNCALWRVKCGKSVRRAAAQNARREEYESFDEGQRAAYSNTHNSKRQQEQPNQWVEHYGKKGQRPAQHEENAPKKESSHVHRPAAKRPQKPATLTNMIREWRGKGSGRLAGLAGA